MDTYAWAYIGGAAVLTGFELWAVLRNKRKGDTITEKTKSMPLTHMAMGGLLVWAVYHFIFSEWFWHVLIDVTAVCVGVVLGLAAHLKHRSKGL